MIPHSSSFKDNILAASREIRAHIIINGVVYADDDYLASINISGGVQNDTKIIGNFIAATATISIIDKAEAFTFNKGDAVNIHIGTAAEKLQLKTFYISSAEFDTVNKIHAIKAIDSADEFIDKKISEIAFAYPLTLRAFLQQICNYVSVPLSAAPFHNEDIVLTEQPNLNGDESLRQVVAFIAECALGNAIINAQNQLEIKSINAAPVDTITAEDYFSFKGTQVYSPNQIILARLPQNDNIAYPVAPANPNPLVIADNPFLDYSEADIRSTYIEALYNCLTDVWAYNLNWRDCLYLECGDIIQIETVSDEYIPVIYGGSYSFKYNGGANSDSSVALPTNDIKQESTLPLSEKLRRTEMAVNKAEGKITAVVEAVETTTNEINDRINQTYANTAAAIQMEADNILATVSEQISESEANTAALIESKIQQTANEIEIQFTETKSTIEALEDDIAEQQNTLQTNIRFDSNGVEIGKNTSSFKTRIDNTEMGFYDGSDKVAYVSNKQLSITDANITKNLILGNFKFEPTADGHLRLVFVGG